MSASDGLFGNKFYRIGAGLTAIWVFGALSFFLITPVDVAVSFVNLVAFLLPLVLIWCAIFVAMAADGLRGETASLRQNLAELKNDMAYQGGPASPGRDDHIRHQLDQIAELTRRNDTRMSAIAAKTLEDTGNPMPARQTAALQKPKVPTPEDLNQPDLPLGMSNEDGRLPISIPEFIKALNFPDDASDKEGFRVLRRALEDRRTAPLISSAKDLLTLLSEDGVYMDDFKPDRARADLWRQFAKGKRGKTVEALGGIRDEAALALTKGRLKNDADFRSTAHEFMTEFVSVLEDFEETADDSELHAMAGTRSAMCFMLLGRVSGTFVNV